jgi:hypothetical protein
MSDINPNCDGAHCREPHGAVRIYPIGSGGNLILCRACFTHENKSRDLKGIYYGRPEEWPRVNWATAKPYPEGDRQ